MEDASPITALPEDPASLRAMIATLTIERDDAARQRDDAANAGTALLRRINELELIKLRLEAQLLRFKKWYYGPRADALSTIGAVNQTLLAFAENLEAKPVDPQDLDGTGKDGRNGGQKDESNDATSATPRRLKRTRGRRDLANFDHLPTTRCEHDLAESDKPCPCCGKVRVKIGEDVSWQVEHIPARFERIEHVRFKYGCTHCEESASLGGPQIIRADKPGQPIDKGLAGPGLLAYIVTSKFADYLPLYRLESIFARSGFEIARPTQSLWCRDVAEIARPLYDLMAERVRMGRVVGTDDTVMPMLDPGAGKAKKARMWVYVGDEDHPYNVFDFTLSRSRDGPSEFLKEYKRVLVADAYGGYDGVVCGNEIARAGCWAHARRKFTDAEKSHPAIAAEAVGIIGTLYAIEERAKLLDLDASSRGELRRAESAPILAVLRDKLFTWRDQLLPKHPMAEAVGYALNQWKELCVFASEHKDAGLVPIDNNASEREMKRIVLNRKNSLFVGSERGGETAAILSSLASTCRRHAIDPQRYLTQLLMNLQSTPMSRLEEWLPDQWKRRDTRQPV